MTGLGKTLMRGACAGFLAMAATLAACSDDTEAPAVSAEPPEPEKVLMTSISALDLGRAYDGVVISVEGLAPGLGYHEPELRDHDRGALSTDGFLQLDFVALAPTPEAAETLPQPGGEKALRIRALRDVPVSTLRGVRGVRVFTATGAATRPF